MSSVGGCRSSTRRKEVNCYFFYDLYDVEPVLGNSEFSESFDDPIDSCIFATPAKGDFTELECCKESVRGG